MYPYVMMTKTSDNNQTSRINDINEIAEINISTRQQESTEQDDGGFEEWNEKQADGVQNRKQIRKRNKIGEANADAESGANVRIVQPNANQSTQDVQEEEEECNRNKITIVNFLIYSVNSLKLVLNSVLETLYFTAFLLEKHQYLVIGIQ